MFSIIKNIFSTNAKEVKRLSGIVAEINSWEKRIKKLTDKQLAAKTGEFKKRLKKESLNDILPEAFAVVREAAQRVIVGQRHFDVQLMASVALFEGKVVEQKTGEGKTLSATPALYLRALAGKGAHLVTVNDYLARRDAGWMGSIFNFLGLQVGCIVHDQAFLFDPQFVAQADDERLSHLRPVGRKEAYSADITYGTNNEFGFDYLRDNMAMNWDDKVQRGHYFAIVDEVDFALIDEARTPLIISSPEVEATSKYFQFASLVKSLSSQTDYTIDEESRSVSLTEHGITKVEKMLGVSNLYEKDFETIHHIENALKAKELFKRDRDYVIRDGKIIIVDEFTGRLMFGRRWSAGLHQAVEAKEGVAIKQESRTLATISFQNYFRLYQILAGMTGTAFTSKEEFEKIYDLETVVVPTNRPMIRQDKPDAIFRNQRAKYAAVAGDVERCYRRGQPVLVGTTSIQKNEIISSLLKHKGIPHQVLNAKNHEKEALIIAQAGRKKAVTVATNMAGRGVDIVLGGKPPEKVQSSPPGAGQAPSKVQSYEEEYRKWKEEHDAVVKLGGLHVIGTERHEARRIDNQLRGRAGRQGDPGSSRFYIALDDDMMRIFGGEKIAGLMMRFDLPEEVPIENKLISRAIEQIQAKVEGVNFDSRRYLVEYDDVMSKQREIIYRIRDKVLLQVKNKDFEGLQETIWDKISKEINTLVGVEESEIDYKAVVNEFSEMVPLDRRTQQELLDKISGLPHGKVKEFLLRIAKDAYHNLEENMGLGTLLEVNKLVLLTTIDKLWMDHLDDMEDLREGIGLRAYGQQDPLSAYKNEAFATFEQLMEQVDYQVARRILRARLTPPPPVFTPAKTTTNVDLSDGMGLVGSWGMTNQPPARQAVKPVTANRPHPGRNDPCWCGSGKKYKKCHINKEPQTAEEQEAYNLYFNNPREWEKKYGIKLKR